VSTFHANVGNGARLFGDITTYERTLAVAQITSHPTEITESIECLTGNSTFLHNRQF
jgi:hypothetical protein